MYILKFLQTMTVVLLSLTLFACGGGGGSSSSAPSPTGAIDLSVTSDGYKALTFNWADYSGASYYKLQVNPDGASGFTQQGGDIIGGSVNIQFPAVYLMDWINAEYILEAFDASNSLIASSTSTSIVSEMLSSITYFKAGNTIDTRADMFGYTVSLAADGNTLAVGAPGENANATGSGAVYVFSRIGSTWFQLAYIKTSNALAFGFGSSVSLAADGNTLAVGAPNELRYNNGSKVGAVYVFSRIDSAWSQQAHVKAISNSYDRDLFGRTVSLAADGNTLAVGAYGEKSNATGVNGDQSNNKLDEAGAVYVFGRSGSTWSQQAYIKASNTGNEDQFGYSVSLAADGNTLAVGAISEDSNATGVNGDQSNNTLVQAGAVYVFSRIGSAWSQQAYVKASNTLANDQFGHTVSLAADGNTLAVGAYGEDSNATGVNGDQSNNTLDEAGAVYVFSRIGSAWSQQAYVKASNTDAWDRFGVSVSLAADGNTLAVGAWNESGNAIGLNGDQSNNGLVQAGAGYVFIRNGSIWSQQAYIKASNTNAGDTFGRTVSLAGDGNTLAVGAISEDSNTTTAVNGDQSNNTSVQAGAVYLY
jgi:hypothetical protein